MDSNLGPLVLVATTLATEPQPQTLNFFCVTNLVDLDLILKTAKNLHLYY